MATNLGRRLLFKVVPNDIEVHRAGDGATRGIRVIGAGLPRTGTLSLRAALRKLLGGNIYHMAEVFDHTEHAEFWVRMIDGKASPAEIKEHFANYCAGVDFPFSYFYKELLKIFPDAKVVLSVRQPDRWPTSVHESIGKLQNVMKEFPVNWLIWLVGMKKLIDMMDYMDQRNPPGCSMPFREVMQYGRPDATKLYYEWVASVKRTVPPERLLVFDVKEGWEPLCKFLDVPVPDEPFPRVNDKAKMKLTHLGLRVVAWSLFVILPIILSLLLAHCYL